jgi:tRNA 5-methylaminomethyl-2-thiouridine biosynthesis bifunctional protein
MSPDRRWVSAPRADISWDVQGVPRSRQFDDLYFSTLSGIAETEYVFLAGNKLAERWQNAKPGRFTIVETGFGSGLNFLVCWQAWLRHAPRKAQLHYISVEKYPLRLAELHRAHAAWPSLADLSTTLLRNYPVPIPGQHRIVLEDGRLILDLVYNDAGEALEQLAEMPDIDVQAWFLDGFTPSRNPDMWTEKLYASMASLSRADTTFATFTSAGHVRRGLETAGFEVTKQTGFGGKREMLYGSFQGAVKQVAPTQTPWHLSPGNAGGQTALVIGAGLAGSTCAAALARRGWSVTVVDAGDVAAAASGNSQGVLYTRLSHRRSDLNEFSLHSYDFAIRYYQALVDAAALRPGEDIEWCGALHLMDDLNEKHALWPTIESLPELVQAMDAETAAQVSGLDSCGGGLFFPTAGWVHPPAVCRALLSHPNINLVNHCTITGLQQEDGDWLARSDDGQIVSQSEVVIIATGIASGNWQQLDWLPLQSIRGQVSHIASHNELAQLRTVICHDGYLPPARNGEHCIGATFDIDDPDTALRDVDHRTNLEKLAQALPSLQGTIQSIAKQPQVGRVGFRTASPDYIPIVGPVPDYARFCQDYTALRRNARQVLPQQGSYLSGLYVSTAHGSRGLTSSPLTAELLAAQICGEPRPVDSSLCHALSPARFIVRDLARNRI